MHGGTEQYFLLKLLSGPAHLGKDVFDNCVCCLDAYTFSVINRSWCPWLKQCSTQAKARERCKSCAHFNFCCGKKINWDVRAIEGSRRTLAFEGIKQHLVFAWCKITLTLLAFTSWGIEIDLFALFHPGMISYWKKNPHNRPCCESSAMTWGPTQPLGCNIWPFYQSMFTINCRVKAKSWTQSLHNGNILFYPVLRGTAVLLNEPVVLLPSLGCRWNNTFELTPLKPGNKLMDAETRRRADRSCASKWQLSVSPTPWAIHFTLHVVICSILTRKYILMWL